MDNPAPFDLAAVLADAQRKESLTDWGPGEFERPLGVLLDEYAGAELNAIGQHILRSGIVHSLRMRLRAQEWTRRHPEILDERIVAPVVVVGMMRSGTTLLQRLLAADPRFFCAYGWEVVEVAPRLDHRFTGVDPRIAVSEAREAKSRQLAPELFTIHPMYAREAEEEIVFLADAFLSHVPESGAHLPRYRSWLDEQDFAPAYAYLDRMLRFVQWQKKRRGMTAERWVLKSPAHLGYLDLLRAQFRDLHIVHMHRDPRTTIASGASLNATLHAMHADHVDRSRVGEQWLQRMGWTNDRAMAVREGWDDDGDRVTDIGFDDAVADPIGQVARVYDAIGLPLTADAETAMRRWLAERPRETARPPYGLEHYGLRPEQVDERFALYNKHFRQYI
ncbi:sulfotransferase family protein [Mycobacterium parmense]|uniref:Putative sulfotransferase n=1 Tax=Mycobacterium parmense TaxID=185642 RepID=A0A7I7YTG0_9MYCO|nr:sulfotransferase [Mycobacterium parmense]MCV7348763.1 sulfotransferase [Mycobacterium parmense]ORW49635.1 sulfotransferase [Mycobacterium parmense]BBZ44273.1 putative sulfotransferase [Mycobacterium parmense]